MSNSTHFHRQLLNFLRQYSHACDLRHLKALAWMVSALICSRHHPDVILLADRGKANHELMR